MEAKEIIGWKQKYNDLLIRHFKAVLLLDNAEVANIEREKWIPNYKKVIDEMTYIICLFDADKVPYTFVECMGGFEV